MRRTAPRPLAVALGEYTREAAPKTLLAAVQACWGEVAGPVVAAEAQPVSERSGTVTIGCSSGTWANELELLAPDLLERLNRAVDGVPGAPAKALRFRVGGLT